MRASRNGYCSNSWHQVAADLDDRMNMGLDRPTAGDRIHPAAGTRLGVPTRWLEDCAWPLWLEHGVDWRRRAFHEHLDLASLRCGAEFRRLRVAARQTYVFSKAASRGVPRARDAVMLGVDFLKGPARLPEGGFAWRFDLDNRPIDRTRDLYDHAFVLLAFAAAAPIVGADSLRPDATRLIDYISGNFSHAAGGYEESIPPAMPRRQNPHMHLFEALLAAHDTFGDEVFFVRAKELADIFLSRFFQAREAALPEYFDAALSPKLDAGRFLVEPGHHYEWVWLLDWYAHAAAAGCKPAWPELSLASDALLGFADKFALSKGSGLVVNGLWSDGAVQDAGHRLWPQTERLKAEARRKSAASDCLARALVALGRHLEGVRPGLWIERIDADGQAGGDLAPATSLYHLTAALTDDAVLALAG
jgi:mannose/cellobiose epimerase-like protein (N-acyl-D-glucosamine 2-epimerase family)